MQTRTVEGWGFMSPDDWNVPSNLWVAERPESMAPGIHLDRVLEDMGVPRRGFGNYEWRRVRITVRVMDKIVTERD